MSTITLNKDYGYEQWRMKNDLADGTYVDAENATWIVDNDDSDGKSNPYPVVVRESRDITLDGGAIWGNLDQTKNWSEVGYKNGNSSAIRVQDAPNIVIRDWRIDKAWDSIRVSWNSNNFVIEDVWVTNGRDDVVENDKLNSGTIRDSLFDGNYGGISLDPSNDSPVSGAGKTVKIDGVLMRMKSYLDGDGDFTHGSPLKLDKRLPMPDLELTNNVFAIEDVNHNGIERLELAWTKVVKSSNNVFLNLSDKPLPSDYPMPPKGWTVLQGQAARDYWTKARDAWVEQHTDGGSSDPITLPPVPVEDEVIPDPVSRPDPVEEDDEVIVDPVTPPAEPEEDEVVDPVTPPAEPEEDEVVDPVTPPAEPEEDEVVDPVTPPAPIGDLQPTFAGKEFEGTRKADVIVGNSLNNEIDGSNGDDKLYGGAGDDVIRGDDGADQMWGGSGKDTFLFKRDSDSREKDGIDTIMDFEKGDKIDVSRINANRDLSGDQAFELVQGDVAKKGQLAVSYDAATGYTMIRGNIDDDERHELTIRVAGEVELTAEDFVL